MALEMNMYRKNKLLLSLMWLLEGVVVGFVGLSGMGGYLLCGLLWGLSFIVPRSQLFVSALGLWPIPAYACRYLRPGYRGSDPNGHRYGGLPFVAFQGNGLCI